MKDKLKEKHRSVVYSFEGRWEKPLLSGKVRVFFRKRRPVIQPNRVFFYVGVPVKQLIGFSKVRSIQSVNLAGAIAIMDQGAITQEELTQYITSDGLVDAIWIGNPNIFETPFDLEFLKKNHNFNPPQSFSYVDEKLEDCLTGEAK